MRKNLGLAVLFSMGLGSWALATQCEDEATIKARALSYAAALKIPVTHATVDLSSGFGTTGTVLGPSGEFGFSIRKEDCGLTFLIERPSQAESKDPSNEPKLECPSHIGKFRALSAAWAISHKDGEPMKLSETYCGSIDRKHSVQYLASWQWGAVDYHVAFYVNGRVLTYFVKLTNDCDLNYITAIP